MIKSEQKVQLSKAHIQKRFVAFVICLLVALLAFFVAIKNLTYFEVGYKTIESEEIYDDELIFNYYCQDRATYKQVSVIYRDLTKQIYQLLDESNEYEGINNVYSINHNINQIITVDSILYDQLKTFLDSGNREILLGPVYSLYKAVFSCDQDYQTEDFSPDKNEQIKEIIQQLIKFINDENSVSIELLADNQVRLNVSEQYRLYMEENGLDCYVDFYWMKNSFIVDFVCDNLTERGLTQGYLCSYDGFSRFMDCDDVIYHYYDILNDSISHICDIEIEKNHCMVTYKSFIMNQFDSFYRYVYQDNLVENCYININDGNDYSAVSSLNIYSDTDSVVKLMLDSYKYYISDSVNINDEGFAFFYLKDNIFNISDDLIKVFNLHENITK